MMTTERVAVQGRTVARSVTALATTPQAPRHRYRIAYWMPAVAHTAAPRLCAFARRCCPCPAAAAPLRRPAKTLLARLRLAGGYLVTSCTAPEAAPLALYLLRSPSRRRRLLLRPGFLAYCPPPAPSASLTASSATPGCRSMSCTSWPAAAYLR